MLLILNLIKLINHFEVRRQVEDAVHGRATAGGGPGQEEAGE